MLEKVQIYLQGILLNIQVYAPKLLMSLAAIFIFFVIAKVMKSFLRKTLPRFAQNELVTELIAKFTFFLLLFIGCFWALDILGLNKTLTTALAGLGVLGFALSFAFQDIATNFISGILIAFLKPFKIGDAIEVGSHVGTVKGIYLRATQLESFTGLCIMIPNKEIFMGRITNFSVYPRRRIDLSCGVAYETDLELVRDLLLSELEKLPNQLPDRPPKLFFTEFSDSSIDFTLQLWIDPTIPGAFWETRHLAILCIKKTLDQANINIPFPIRTLDLPQSVSLTKN